jgi:NADH-ubiquinone oxidoreductase chain 5
MEGPTPVSALLHAATMVTAGVFLLIRTSYIFELSSTSLLLIAFIGGLTSIVSASIAIFQTDIKKIIAYSTCSQLGYMIFSCGFSQYHLSIFHLFNHAFFKALLFLSSGIILHSLNDEQDIRKMGSLIYFLPLTYCLTLIGSLSLIGFPFLSGFYSKDAIVEVTIFYNYSIKGLFLSCLGLICVFLTSIYSTKLIYYVYLCKSNSFKEIFISVKENFSFQVISLIILVLPSIFIGYMFKDLIIGVGADFLENSIFIRSSNFITDFHFLYSIEKLIPLFFSFLGIFYCFYIVNLIQNYNLIKFKK